MADHFHAAPTQDPSAHTSTVGDAFSHHPHHHHGHQEPNHHQHYHDPLDPPPYPQDPAGLEDQPLNASHVRFNIYHTFKDDSVRRRRPRRGKNLCVTLLGVFIMVIFFACLLSLALSRRSDLSNDPTDPDGTRHGRGGYGIWPR